MKVFKEEQRFTQWWVWVLFISLNTLFLYGIYQQLILKIPFGDNPMPNGGLVITAIGMLIFTLFFFSLKLKTKIDETGIYYHFPPFQLTPKKKNWSDIVTVRVIKFRPIMDYGGWGIKHGSYTVKGNKGIQVVFKNGEKILIGTQKENEAKRVLETYKNKLS